MGTESVPVFGNIATEQGGRGPKADLPESRSKPKSGTPGVPKTGTRFPTVGTDFLTLLVAFFDTFPCHHGGEGARQYVSPIVAEPNPACDVSAASIATDISV